MIRFFAAMLCGLAPACMGQTIAHHTGMTDPEAEGFILSTTGFTDLGPIDENGIRAWRAGSTGLARYGTGNLPPATAQAALKRGWRMHARVRVAEAPDDRGLVAVNLENVGGRRYDMNIGIDDAGAFFVRINEDIDTFPALVGVGPSFTAPDTPDGYHTADLVFDADTQTADLYIDGVLRHSGYDGHTRFVRPLGFYFAGYEGHTGHFADVFMTIMTECPADLAAPFGVLDLADIGAFVTAFLAGEENSAADLTAPFGVLDLADITAFVSSFNAGCP